MIPCAVCGEPETSWGLCLLCALMLAEIEAPGVCRGCLGLGLKARAGGANSSGSPTARPPCPVCPGRSLKGTRVAGEKHGGGPPPSTNRYAAFAAALEKARARKDETASLIDDETQELLNQGISGMAVIGYRQAPARQEERSP